MYNEKCSILVFQKCISYNKMQKKINRKGKNIMDNSYRFFENRACKYFPCHEGLEDFNCLFCYCPLYSMEKCPGKNEYITSKDGRRIKVCTNCTFPHEPENYDTVIKLLSNRK